ncbi:MAG: NF038122 family metalloprotease [Phormidesmis sp.]
MANFNFAFSPQTSAQQMLAFEMAGQIWSNYLQDDITVDIKVTGTSTLPDNVLGGALPTYVEVDVDQVRAALVVDATSNNDATALANLEVANGFSALLEDDSYVGDRITLTQAQADALGIPSTVSPDALDGQILLNTLSRNRELSWSEDLQRSGGVADNELDLLSVALHEIGHILGFISGVDSEAQGGLSRQLAQTTLLDLYRYSDRSLEQNSRELTRGAAAYFSLDGGQTSLANFSTGIVPLGNYIDGYQASHWGPGNAAADRRTPLELKLEGSPSQSLQAFTQILFDLSFEASEEDWVDSPNRLFSTSNSQPSVQTSSSGLLGSLLGGVMNLAGGLLGGLSSNNASGTQQTLAPQSSDEGLPTLGIMDPSLAAGDRSNISELDLTAFDAIGYDLTDASTTNQDYSQLLAQAEIALAAQMGIEVAELRDVLQGNIPEQSDDSSAVNNASAPPLSDSRWQLLYNTLDTTENNGLYERRRSRYGRRYASFWQEEGFDADSVQIVSNGGSDSAEISLENGSLNVTQVQAIPSAPLILRTQNLQGDDANDLILPAYDQAQTLETGNGNNVAVLGKAGGRIKGGSGNDTMIIQGSQATIQDTGGDNLVWTAGTKDDNQSIQTGDGNDRIYFTPLEVDANSGRSRLSSGGLFGWWRGGLLGLSASSKYEVNAGSGDNILSIQGHDSQALTITTGAGNDLILAKGQSAKITTGNGNDKVILGDSEGSYFQGSGHATLSDFDRADQLQLFGKASDYRIRRNQLLYRGDTIAEFDQGIDFSLTGSQVAYVGSGQSPSNAATIPSLGTSLQSVVDRYTAQPEISYRIVGGEDANQFQIDRISGQLKFNAGVTAQSDADQDNWFEVSVAAIQGEEGGQQTMDSQTLQVTFNNDSLDISTTSLATDEASLTNNDALNQQGNNLIQNGTEVAPLIGSNTTGSIPDIIAPAIVDKEIISIAPSLGENLLTNGSFEANALSNDKWTHFNAADVAGWQSWRGERIEIWDSGLLGVESTQGSNHLELDYGRGLDGIYQDIQTHAYQTYLLTFDMRGRDRKVNSDDESVVVEWNGQTTKVDGYHAATVGEWTTITVEVEGTGGQDRLLLRESTTRGASDGTGPFLDNVQLRATPSITAIPDAYTYGATTPVNQTKDNSPFDLTQNNLSGNIFDWSGTSFFS